MSGLGWATLRGLRVLPPGFPYDLGNHLSDCSVSTVNPELSVSRVNRVPTLSLLLESDLGGGVQPVFSQSRILSALKVICRPPGFPGSSTL